jgi:AcrR family transcriptional regulator
MSASTPQTAPRRRRLNRDELKELTRANLLEAARTVFSRRGFHAASLAEIAEEAGYSTGAVYSNFGGKDDLFLTMLDEQLAQSAREQSRSMREAENLEQAIRAAARELHGVAENDPARTPLTIEFWIHAARKPELRKRINALHRRQVGAIAQLLEELAERHDVEWVLPAAEVARGGGALSRGSRLERLVDDPISGRAFEEMFSAYLMGLARPRRRTEGGGSK